MKIRGPPNYNSKKLTNKKRTGGMRMIDLEETSVLAKYEVSETEYKLLKKWDDSNHELLEPQYRIDHCIIEQTQNVFRLFCHGTSDGLVKFNNKFLTLPELEQAVRDEQKIVSNEDIIIKLTCCYDGVVGSYLSTHCWIVNTFNTNKKVKYDFISNNEKYYSYFFNLAYACYL